jgi:predicted glycosyltransferase
MIIWFDISNSPHINMFYDLIRTLEKEGHSVVITSRPLANTIELLEQKNLSHTVIGVHYGKNMIGKLFGFPIRVYQLWKHLRDKNIDLAVSQSSFHSPIVAFILGKTSIYTNDNEHALGNLPSFLFANAILLPESFKLNYFAKLAFIKRKIQFYPGIKEGIYLWRLSEKLKLKHKQPLHRLLNLYIRPEPSTAQYYSGKENFLDDLIQEVSSDYKITVLPRNSTQMAHYSQHSFRHVNVAHKPISFEEIAKDCDFFVGAGGSMTRELAMVGVPTVSVYQDQLLEVDKILIEQNLMTHVSSITKGKLATLVSKQSNDSENNLLMEKGKQAYAILYDLILNIKK